MVLQTKEFQSDTSTSSDLEYLTSDDKWLQIFCKEHLKGRLFMGIFQEKRYVDSINSYRDVVSIDKTENKLIKDILIVKQKIENSNPTDRWIGMTTPEMVGAPASYSVWVELPESTLFGKYWFKVKRIKFNTKEICLRVEVLRPINHESPQISCKKKNMNNDNIPLNYDMFDSIKKEAKEKMTYILQNITTVSNFKESIVFLCMLLATLVISLFELLKYGSEYLLRFINEFSNLLKSITPLMQIGANLIERLFRSLCMLIAYLIKGSDKMPVPPQNNYSSVDYVYQNTRALPAPSRRRGVIIEEVE